MLSLLVAFRPGWPMTQTRGWRGRLRVLQRARKEIKAYERMGRFYTMEGDGEGTLKLAVRSSVCSFQKARSPE